ncbi:aminotransferase class IV, partial [Vibrio cholerae O1]
MQLFETMKIDNGHIPRLTYHTNRIKCSSERLNFKFDEHAWRNELNDVTTKYHSGQYRLKIVLNAESEFETIVSPLPEKSSFTAKFQVLPKV